MFKYLLPLILVAGCASGAIISTSAACPGDDGVGTTTAGYSWRGGSSSATITAKPAYLNSVDIVDQIGFLVFFELWCKRARGGGDDQEMQRFVPIEEMFKGRHFDRQLIVLCVSWYASFKLSLRDLVIMMGDGDLGDPYNDSAVGAALPSEFEKRWRLQVSEKIVGADSRVISVPVWRLVLNTEY